MALITIRRTADSHTDITGPEERVDLSGSLTVSRCAQERCRDFPERWRGSGVSGPLIHAENQNVNCSRFL